jgi:hypothetical protein
MESADRKPRPCSRRSTVRDPAMSDQAANNLLHMSALGTAGDHPDRDTQILRVAPATQNQTNTFRPAFFPVACWGVREILFSFDSSFVSPRIAGHMGELVRLRKRHPDAPLSVFGHADPVGDDDYNKQLSGRRAQAIYALLTRQPDFWEDLYCHPFGGDDWGLRTIQVALNTLDFPLGNFDGKLDDDTTEAVRKFQDSNGLSRTGSPGPETRAVVFARYMEKLLGDELRLTPKDFLAKGIDKAGKGDFQGCGAFNPILLFSRQAQQRLNHPNKKEQRNHANAPNRRVVIFLFRPDSEVDPQKWPCPRVKEGVAGCERRFWSDGQTRRECQPKRREYMDTQDTFACRFYDRIAGTSPCESVARVVRIRLFDHMRTLLIGAPFEATLTPKHPTLANSGQTAAGFSDHNGDAILFDVAVPGTCNIRWKHAGSSNTPAEFEYELDVFIDLTEKDEDDDEGESADDPGVMTPEAARRRLNNLGYSIRSTLCDALKLFQQDIGLPPEEQTGELDSQTTESLRQHHDVLRNPPPLQPDRPQPMAGGRH